MQTKTLFSHYLKELAEVTQQGDAREESYYPALADLFNKTAAETGRKLVRVTTLPKATEAGNPDFRIWNGSDRIIGYVEAKRPTEERLDGIEDSEQFEDEKYFSFFFEPVSLRLSKQMQAGLPTCRLTMRTKSTMYAMRCDERTLEQPPVMLVSLPLPPLPFRRNGEQANGEILSRSRAKFSFATFGRGGYK